MRADNIDELSKTTCALYKASIPTPVPILAAAIDNVEARHRAFSVIFYQIFTGVFALLIGFCKDVILLGMTAILV